MFAVGFSICLLASLAGNLGTVDYHALWRCAINVQNDVKFSLLQNVKWKNWYKVGKFVSELFGQAGEYRTVNRFYISNKIYQSPSFSRIRICTGNSYQLYYLVIRDYRAIIDEYVVSESVFYSTLFPLHIMMNSPVVIGLPWEGFILVT